MATGQSALFEYEIPPEDIRNGLDRGRLNRQMHLLEKAASKGLTKRESDELESLQETNRDIPLGHVRTQRQVAEVWLVQVDGNEDPTPADIDHRERSVRNWLRKDAPRNGTTSYPLLALLKWHRDNIDLPSQKRADSADVELRKLEADATLKEMAVAEQQGRLISRQAVQEALAARAAVYHNGLAQLPTISAQLEGLDPDAREAVLRQFGRELLRSVLSDQYVQDAVAWVGQLQQLARVANAYINADETDTDTYQELKDAVSAIASAASHDVGQL
jgi:hypothetical protein